MQDDLRTETGWESLGTPDRDPVGDTIHKWCLQRTFSNEWRSKYATVQAPELCTPWQVEVKVKRGTRPTDLANALRALADKVEAEGRRGGPEVLERGAIVRSEHVIQGE